MRLQARDIGRITARLLTLRHMSLAGHSAIVDGNNPAWAAHVQWIWAM